MPAKFQKKSIFIFNFLKMPKIGSQHTSFWCNQHILRAWVFCGSVCINYVSSRHDYGLKTTLRDPKNVGGKLEVPGNFLFDSANVLKLVCFLLSNFFDFVHFTMACRRCIQNVNNVRLTQQSALKQLEVIRKHACTISKKVDFYFQLCHDAQNWLPTIPHFGAISIYIEYANLQT